MNHPVLGIVVSVLLACPGAVAAEKSEPRYVAAFVDGTRVEGRAISGWHSHTGPARLDTVTLTDQSRPLRWLVDRSLPVFKPGEGRHPLVEFIGGDRLPGRVAGYESGRTGDAAGQPGHLLVESTTELGAPGGAPRKYVRVLPRFVSRVVWSGDPSRWLQPGTLFTRDGRRFALQSLLWESEGVRFLSSGSAGRFAFDEIAEIHLPARSGWTVYCEELASIDADCSSRLYRFETTDGLVGTGSMERFRARTADSTGTGKRYYVVQPAWSLDPLFVPLAAIRVHCWYAPHEFPLSRLCPSRSVQQPLLGSGYGWQRDRNVHGTELRSGGQVHGWGFGTHATCELHFELPEFVRGFRSRVGLDELSGNRGCARALVFQNRTDGTPLYRSGHLIGSRQLVDTGQLPLPSPGQPGRSLVLVADAAHRDRPAGADPLDVRDMVDWIEPLLVLDPLGLQAKVAAVPGGAVPAWLGWRVAVEGGGLFEPHVRWDETDPLRPRFAVDVATAGRTLSLAADRIVHRDTPWLLLRLRQVTEAARPGCLEVRVDGKPVARAELQPYGIEVPYFVSLQRYAGRKVPLEVVYTPADDKERIEWQAVALIGRPERVEWVTLRPTAVRSLGGAEFTQLDDGSILAGGEIPFSDVYTIEAKTELSGITALRLEALVDGLLPNRGPGCCYDGNFCLSRFTVGLAAERPEPPRGRYVRVDLPVGPLTLAEVQVISQGKNVAPTGTATQSSIGYEAPAELAIDGNPNGDFPTTRSCSHTSEEEPFAGKPAWWELDLGQPKPIECIAVWNRNSFVERLSNFTVSVLDAERKSVWQRKVADYPRTMIELEDVKVQPVAIRSADASFSQENWHVEKAVRSDDLVNTGWAVGPLEGKPHVAAFTFEQPIDPRDKILVVKMKFFSPWDKHALGRFRLSITTSPPPLASPRIGMEVPLLAD